MNEDKAKTICDCLSCDKDQKECRQYIDYPDEHNCTLVSVYENGEMSLREIAKRLGISHVRVMQIEKKALKKIEKNIH